MTQNVPTIYENTLSRAIEVSVFNHRFYISVLEVSKILKLKRDFVFNLVQRYARDVALQSPECVVVDEGRVWIDRSAFVGIAHALPNNTRARKAQKVIILNVLLDKKAD